jgi:hypothetical protein
VLTSKPTPPPGPSLVAGRVQRFEDYVAANEVQWESFGTSADEVAAGRGFLRDRWTARIPPIMHAT